MKMTLTEQKYKIYELIERGYKIKETAPTLPNGTHVLDVDASSFATWMGEINIFNERYLKNHPLYQSIHTTYFQRIPRTSCCDSMIGHLQALEADKEYFGEPEEYIVAHLTFDDLIEQDIKRIDSLSFLGEAELKEFYIEITSRYADDIPDFGKGLYSYYPESNHFDVDIGTKTIKHNFKLIKQKLIMYMTSKDSGIKRAQHIKAYDNNKVFIVHGHDNEAKESVARMLERTGFDAIILHEQASSGKTIIEKIEKYSEVAFAVVLYTECDLGRDKKLGESNNRFRARQNVVFEHGYLIGRLGRDRVCALVKGEVETPGDISGVVYINMDDKGAWKLELAKEMKSVGLNIDLNKI